MKKAILMLCIGSVAALAAKNDDVKRINASNEVFKEIMAAPDKGIPQDILEKAECVVIVPGLKRAGFIIGGQYGKGVMTCKTASGWSGPSMIRLEGGSFGAQIGGGETDLVLVVMNKSGAQKLMKSEFTIGGDAAAMGGPVGRQTSANTDALMHAQILSYSRARGLFAGVSLDGSTLREDHDDNVSVYGKEVTHEAILTGKVKAPATAAPLLSTLKPYVKPAAKDGERARTTK